MIRIGQGLEHTRRYRILLGVSVLQERVEGVDLRELAGWVRSWGYCRAWRQAGLVGLGRGRCGFDAKGKRPAFNGPGKGQIRAQRVLWPKGENARVVLGDRLHDD